MKKYRDKITGLIVRIQNIAIVRMVQGVMGINKDNQLSAFAAQAAFFLLLSFFPFAMMLLIGIRFLPVTQAEFVALIEDGDVTEKSYKRYSRYASSLYRW